MHTGVLGVAEVVAILLAAAVALGGLAERYSIPAPVLLVAGGVGLSYLPGIPTVPLEPEIALLVFVAPLLYADGFFAPARELKNNALSIGLLASVLVIATAAGVGVAAHYVIELDWPVAFALGAALSATDALAPAQVLEREAAEPRLLAVVRGESLLNDGVAFALLGVAATAAASQEFNALEGVGELALSVVGGAAGGVLAGWLAGILRRRVQFVHVEAAISILTPFAAYIAAELAHGSGILAAVVAGLFVGTRSYSWVDPLARLEIQSAWRVISFALNSLLFVLVGLQTREIVDAVDEPAGRVLLAGLALFGAVIGLRLLWALTIAPVWRGTARQLGSRRIDPPASLPWRVVLGWSGVRGSVSLAAAVAIPTTLDAGGPVQGRDLAILLVLVVIGLTLVVQGLTLRPLVRALGLTDPDAIEAEERLAAQAATGAALDALQDAAERHGLDEDERRWLAREYELRSLRAGEEHPDGEASATLDAASRTDAEVLGAAREAILALEEEGAVRGEVAQEVIRRLDLSSARLRH